MALEPEEIIHLGGKGRCKNAAGIFSKGGFISFFIERKQGHSALEGTIAWYLSHRCLHGDCCLCLKRLIYCRVTSPLPITPTCAWSRQRSRSPVTQRVPSTARACPHRCVPRARLPTVFAAKRFGLQGRGVVLDVPVSQHQCHPQTSPGAGDRLPHANHRQLAFRVPLCFPLWEKK